MTFDPDWKDKLADEQERIKNEVQKLDLVELKTVIGILETKVVNLKKDKVARQAFGMLL